MCPAQPDHRQADKREGGERADRGHVAEGVDVEEAGGECDDQADQDGVDPGGPELRVDLRETLGSRPSRAMV